MNFFGQNIRSIEEAYIIKLNSLKMLAKHLPTISDHDYISDSELAYCRLAAIVISNPDTHPIQVMACAGILDMLLPKWRNVAPKSIMGKVVDRNDPLVTEWRRKCIERDNNKCVECQSTDDLAVHHLAQWAEYPEMRIELFNGKTLCGKCHHSQHLQMGAAMFIKDKNNGKGKQK